MLNNMSTLREKIGEDLKNAMRARDEFSVITLRTLLSSLKNAEIEKKKRDEGLSDEEIIEVLAREVKQRNDSIALFTKGDRQDLVKKTQREIDILKAYMPEVLNETKIQDLIREALLKTNAKFMSDFGIVMKEIAPKIRGRADGSYVAQLVKEKLQ